MMMNSSLLTTALPDSKMTGNDSNSVPESYFDLFRNIRFYCMGIILPIGLLCNIFAFSVFICSPMRKSIPGVYFMALAIADNTVLLGEFLTWLNSRDSHDNLLGINFINIHIWLCKSINFVRYTGRIWSSWITISITVERFLTVAFPLKVAQWSSLRKAKCVIILTLVAAASYATYPFFTLEIRKVVGKDYDACQIAVSKRTHYMVLTWVLITVGELFVPSAIVAFFTSIIIFKLAKARRRRLTMSRVDSGRTRPRSSEMSPTYALLGIAITFVLIRLPYTVMFYVNEHKKELFPNIGKWSLFYIYATYSVAQTFSVMNYAMNFCLYCLCGSTFRAEMRRCILCQKRRSTHGSSIRTGPGGGASFKSVTTKLTPDLSDRAHL